MGLIKEVVKTILKQRVEIQESYINEMLRTTEEIKDIGNFEVEVNNGFLNVKGSIKKSMYDITLNQDIYMDDHIELDRKIVDLSIKNHQGENSDNGSFIEINLQDNEKLNDILKKLSGIEIIKDLDIDEIQFLNGRIFLSSKDKVDIVLRQQLIQDFIARYVIGKVPYLKALYITVKSGYLNAVGYVEKKEFTARFNKNILLKHFDILGDRRIMLQLMDDYAACENYDEDNTALRLYTDKISKLDELLNKFLVKFIAKNFILTGSHKIRFEKSKKAIIVYPRG